MPYWKFVNRMRGFFLLTGLVSVALLAGAYWATRAPW